MPKTSMIVLGMLLGATLLTGCKKDDETAPDAGAVVVPTPAIDPALVNDASAAPVVPVTPVPVVPTPATTPKVDAGTVATDAGAGTVTVSNCRANCLAQLASCMTPKPGTNGGAPVFADANKCKAASDTCQAACK